MNRSLLSILITAVVSGAVGYCFGRYFRKEEIEQEINEELEGLKAHYKQSLERMEQKYKGEIDLLKEQHSNEPISEETENENPKIPRVEISKTKTEYHEISKDERRSEHIHEQYEEGRAEEEHPTEDEDDSIPRFDDWPDPYNISQKQFEEEYNWYDKVSLTYYTESDMLRYDDPIGNLMYVEDILHTVGAETYQMMMEAELEYIYARDESVDADYEIEIRRCKCPEHIDEEMGG